MGRYVIYDIPYFFVEDICLHSGIEVSIEDIMFVQIPAPYNYIGLVQEFTVVVNGIAIGVDFTDGFGYMLPEFLSTVENYIYEP